MAEEKAGEAGAEKGTPAQAPEKARDEEAEVVSVELLAPAGWKKKFMLNEDGSPRRNEIIFISPTGEEIKSKRQLQQYLKSHPGGPPSSEFDWGTGDTPRRSARIRERAKAVEMETPEDEKPKKRERKSSSKKAAKEKKDDGDGADKTAGTKEDVTDEEAKAPADVEMKEADDGNKVKDEGVPAEPAAKEDAAEKVEGAGEQVSVLKTDESVQENADAGLENNNAAAAAAAAAPGAEFAISVPETEKDKADAKAAENAPSSGESKEAPAKNSIHREENQDDAAVMKEVPSANRSDGQHLPKPSPVNC